MKSLCEHVFVTIDLRGLELTVKLRILRHNKDQQILFEYQKIMKPYDGPGK